MHQTRETSCIGKQAHGTKSLAKQSAIRTAKKMGERVKNFKPYLCPFCDYWHVGRRNNL